MCKGQEKECEEKGWVTLNRKLHVVSVWKTSCGEKKQHKNIISAATTPHLSRTYLTISWKASGYQSINRLSRCAEAWWAGVHLRSRQQSKIGTSPWSSHALFPLVWPPDPDTCLNVRVAAYRHVPPSHSEHPSPPSPLLLHLLSSLLCYLCVVQLSEHTAKTMWEKWDREEVRTSHLCEREPEIDDQLWENNRGTCLKLTDELLYSAFTFSLP